MSMPTLDACALALHIFCSFFLTGVIVLVQGIHYPCFASIEEKRFAEFHAQHSRVLGWIAAPTMVGELVTGVWLARGGAPLFMGNALGVVGLWLLTFLVSVPAHERLGRGFNQSAWERLCRTNWLRTILWGVRSLGLLIWLVIHLRTGARV